MASFRVSEFSHLVSLATAAAVDARHWQDLTDRLAQRFDGCGLHLIGFDAQGTETGFVASGYDPAMTRIYGEYFAGVNAWAPGFLSHEAGNVVRAEKMCPDADLVRTEFYNDWIRPQDDIALGGGAIIADGLDGTFVIGGNVPRRMGREREEEWLSLLSRLMPHLQASWRIARSLTAARLGAGRTVGTLVLDERARILFADDAAAAMLEVGQPLGLRGNRLSGGQDPAVTKWLAWLRHVMATGGTSALPDLSLVDWILRAACLSPDRLGESLPLPLLGCSDRAVCVTIQPRASVPSAPERLVARHGLTRSEAEVAIALAEGATPAEVAEARSVSLHTVRNQIKSAMWKCGVSRQTQLVALAARI
jgi:DNA-binding CsgD family transcriptional regulator/PAS domain-containing protein